MPECQIGNNIPYINGKRGCLYCSLFLFLVTSVRNLNSVSLGQLKNFNFMSQEISKRYAGRGVSAGKEDVHNAIKNVDKGLFPQAFCKIVPDHLTGDEEHCLIMHADGAGTKSSLAYMYWKETGDLSVWKGIAQDALIMNIDDLLCVGATDNILLSSTIGRNKNLIPGEVISAIINGTEELLEDLKEFWSGDTFHRRGNCRCWGSCPHHYC
jgi:phosphoribosylformylglycinamidine cyclo-ligase